MRKLALFLSFAVFMLLPFAVFAQQNPVAVVLTRIPLASEYNAYNIENNPIYKDLGRPLSNGDFSYSETEYISENPASYSLPSAGAFLVLQSITSVERTEGDGRVFFSIGFSYEIFQHDAQVDKLQFSVLGTGDTDSQALDMCFRNAMIYVADVGQRMNSMESLFTIVSTHSREYILNCGKKQKIKIGDEFHVTSKRTGEKSGKLWVVDVDDDISFAQPIFLNDMAIPGDIISHVKLLGFGTDFYYNYIFSDSISCLGVYEEYSRGFRTFRPVVGVEYMNGDDGHCNLYAGLKAVRHLGYIDLASMVTFGRGYTDNAFRHTGGSIKLIADYTVTDWFKISAEGGCSKWFADHDDEYSNYGGLFLGAGFTFRY